MKNDFYEHEKKHAESKLMTMAALMTAVIALLIALTIAVFTSI